MTGQKWKNSPKRLNEHSTLKHIKYIYIEIFLMILAAVVFIYRLMVF